MFDIKYFHDISEAIDAVKAGTVSQGHRFKIICIEVLIFFILFSQIDALLGDNFNFEDYKNSGIQFLSSKCQLLHICRQIISEPARLYSAIT